MTIPTELLFLILALFVGAYISFVVGIAALQRRYHRGAIALLLAMVTLSIWNFGSAMNHLSQDISTKFFWYNLQYLVIPIFMGCWLVLNLQISGAPEKWVNRIIPFLSIEWAWFNYHIWRFDPTGILFEKRQIEYFEGWPILAEYAATGFYIHLGYSYVLFLIGFALFFRGRSKARAWRADQRALHYPRGAFLVQS